MKRNIEVPLDNRYDDKIIPKITNSMKAECIGEFSWTEEAPYYNEHGEIIEHEAERVVPWDLCKKIYQRMALIANKDLDNDD